MPHAGPVRVLLAASLVIASAASVSAQDVAAGPESIEWHLTAYRAGGELAAVPPLVDATLLLADGVASGSNGCNSFNGGYSIDGSALAFDEAFATTLAACSGDAAAVEQGYMTNLPAVAGWSIVDDALQLADGDDVVVLTFERPVGSLTQADVAALLAAMSAQQERIERLEQRLDNVRVSTLRRRISQLERQVESLRDQVAGLRGSSSASGGASSAFTSAERLLLGAIPTRIRSTCSPRRSENPSGTLAAVQCKPDGDVVRDMAYYLMNGPAAERVWTQRMRENGVTSGSTRCWNGKPSQEWSTGNFETMGCYVNSDGRANLRLAHSAAGCSQLKVDGTWVKRPALYVAVLGNDSDIAKLTRWAYPRRIGDDDITRSLEQPGAPGSPFCGS